MLPLTRINILGVGSIGKYVAFSLGLRSVAPQHRHRRVALHLRQSELQSWADEGHAIRAVTPGGRASVAVEGFDVESLAVQRSSHIKNLIVATKAHATVAALQEIKHRLNKRSNILFLQNGMGVTEEVAAQVFPDEASRPIFSVGICSAGIYSPQSTSSNPSRFKFVHAGAGRIQYGCLQDPCPSDVLSLRRFLLMSAAFDPQPLPRPELLQARLEKLAVNTVINPLTVLFNTKNGRVFDHPAAAHIAKRLLKETGRICDALMREELGDAWTPRTAFDPSMLRLKVQTIAIDTAENTSSMRQDVHAGKPTEINYLNGYLVAQAKRLGLPCETHSAVVGAIKGLEVGLWELASVEIERRDKLLEGLLKPLREALIKDFAGDQAAVKGSAKDRAAGKDSAKHEGAVTSTVS